MSVATLGFAVDSSSLVGASKALNDLTAAAKPAARAAADLSNVSQAGSQAIQTLTRAHAGLSSQAMAAQHAMRSMVEQLAMGVPPTQTLTTQLNHLTYAASGPGGLSRAFGDALGSFRAFLTPTTAVVAGLAAIGAGSLAAINAVAKLEKQFDDTASAAGLTVAQLHGLDSAAAFKGIATPEFLSAMDKFGASVYEAQHNMGGLADTFRVNNVSAKTFNDYLGKSADLIKNAGSNQQRLSMLQQMGLPSTMEWVRLMSQGHEGIDAAILSASKFNTAADQQLIGKARAFDEAWNTATKNLGTGLRNVVVEGASWLDSLSDKATALLMRLPGVGSSVPTNMLRNAMTDSAAGYKVGSSLTRFSPVDQFYSPLGSAAPGNKPSLNYNDVQRQIQLEQQHLALLGQTATASDAVRSVELSVQAARLSGVSITNRQVDSLKQLAVEQSLGITALKSQTDSYNVEAATIGMSAGAAAQYTAVQNALNDALRSHRALTQDNVAAITAQASALGDAAAKADLMRSAYSGLVQGPLQTLSSQIANGAKFFDALRQAGVTALTSISSKLADMAAQNLWQAALGGSSGGGLLSLLHIGGGATSAVGSATTLGSLYHSGGIVGSEPTSMRYVHPTYFDDAPRFHTGLMPDEFPAILQKGEGVFTRGQMAAMGGSGAANSNAPQDININVNVSGARGSQEITDAVNAGVGQALSTYRKSPAFVQDVSTANTKAGKLRLGRG